MNGWKLLERLDDDKWLEISRKAGYCRMAGNEDKGWIFSNGWKLVKWLDFFGWLEIDRMAGYLLMAGYSQMAGNQWKGWKLVEWLEILRLMAGNGHFPLFHLVLVRDGWK